jgi:hypothetical protein
MVWYTYTTTTQGYIQYPLHLQTQLSGPIFDDAQSGADIGSIKPCFKVTT